MMLTDRERTSLLVASTKLEKERAINMEKNYEVRLTILASSQQEVERMIECIPDAGSIIEEEIIESPHYHEKVFTDMVAVYIKKGYVLNTISMNGFQNEIARVDLHNGKHFVRVLLEHERQAYCVRVGRATLPEDYEVTKQTIWNCDLEYIECIAC